MVNSDSDKNSYPDKNIKSLKEENYEFEALNEEYLQMNEELKSLLEEQQSLNQRLKEREKIIHNILNSVDEMIWSQKIGHHQPDYISTSCKRVLGIDASEMKENIERWKEIIHPDDKGYVIKNIENFEPLRYFEMEYRIVLPNGNIKWILDKRKITYDEKNRPLKIDGLAADITVKKRSEEKLNISQKTYEGILDSINDAVYIQDQHGFFLNINKAAEKIEGLSKDQIIGKNIEDLDPENKNNSRKILETIKKAYNGKPQLIEFYGKSKHDKEFIQEVSISPCYYFGEKAVIAVGRDITGHKKNEIKIKEQATRLNAILKALPDLLFITDKNGFYKEVFTHDPSDKVVESKKVEGINVKDVFGEKEGERHIKAYRNCVESSEMTILEYQIQESENKQYFEARLSPLTDELVLAIVRDITETRSSEEKLSREQRLLQSLMDNIPDTIYFKDKKSKFTKINLSQANIMGLKNPEDALGKTDFDFFNSEHSRKAYQEEKSLLKTGKPILGRIEHIKTSQGWRWLNASKVPIKNNDGEITGLVGVSRDITQLVKTQEKLAQSEEKYRNITENAFDGIYIRNGKYFEYVNDRFCKITGYSKKELLAKNFDHKKILKTETPKNSVPFPKELHAASKTREGIIVDKDGKNIQVEYSTSQIVIENKNLVMGIIRDITERKNNEELRNQVLLSKKSAEFKQKFLANMSHEIRTPLTGILGMVDLLSKTHLDDHQREFINTLKLSGVNLREIINLILDYSKIEAGKIVLKKEVFETNQIFESAGALFKTICKKDIRWETYVDPKLPQYLLADQHRIFQIVNNFVSNAVKFTFDGKIELRALLQPNQISLDYNGSDESGPDELIVRMEVIDTGIGIKKEKIPALFLPFSQIGQEETRYFEGTGLGLSISKELTKLMGGEIGVESDPTKGSKFWFTFKAKSAKKPEEPKSLSDHPTHERKSLNILFAEDQRVNQMVISLMMKELGHTCTTVKNGKEAIETYPTKKFDLILMDIKMPVMDGITATQKLKNTYKNLPPIVGLSANAFEGDREKYMNRGMDEYLTKPLEVKDFLLVLDQLNL
ncbi:MAG: PAS domain S-box protein [Bacteroidales bacterium]